MGISILDLVLEKLRRVNFQADVAFPGQKYPRIEDTVATVHIAKVDRADLTVTVEVNILCPASMGGTACEIEALRAMEALRWSGAVCVQNGCSYDGVSQVYVVAILATYTGVTEDDDTTLGPGFQVFLDDNWQRSATAVTTYETREWRPEYAMGEIAPVGVSRGSGVWEITLEERIPVGYPENTEPQEDFTMRIVTDAMTEYFCHCRWLSIQRELSCQGMRKIRKGIAMERRVI